MYRLIGMIAAFYLFVAPANAQEREVCENWAGEVERYFEVMKEVRTFSKEPTNVMLMLPSVTYKSTTYYEQSSTPDTRDMRVYPGPKDDLDRSLRCSPWLMERRTDKLASGTVEYLIATTWWEVLHRSMRDQLKLMEEDRELYMYRALTGAMVEWSNDDDFDVIRDKLKGWSVVPEHIHTATDLIVELPFRHRMVTQVMQSWMSVLWDASSADTLALTGSKVKPGGDKYYASQNLVDSLIYRREKQQRGTVLRYRVGMARIAQAYAFPLSGVWVHLVQEELKGSTLPDKTELLARLNP